METVKDEITKAIGNVSDSAILQIHHNKQDADAKTRAAETAARDMFSDQPIPDVGSEVWRQMLLYAREFAAVVFADKEQPQLASGGICVLCQQDLDDAAARRLADFDGYIIGRAAQESAAAKSTYEQCRNDFLAFSLKNRREIETLLAGYAALSADRKGNVTGIATFVEKAGKRIETVKSILRDGNLDRLHGLDPLPGSPALLIVEDISRLEIEITALGDAARDETALTALALRHAQLSDQKRLSEGIEVSVERRNKLEERHRLATCRSECRLTVFQHRTRTPLREAIPDWIR